MAEGVERVRYSVTIPLYNERESIAPLYERLKAALEPLGRPWECVLVDDGSSDDTFAAMQQIALSDPRFVAAGLRQNSGKSLALATAFSIARGDFIITMDGDLQHDPADVPRFVEQLEAGYDIVGGRRSVRSEGPLQRLSTWFANGVLSTLTGIHLHDWGSGFKAYRRALVSDVPIYGELQRLIPLLALRRGAKVTEIPITAAPREHGVSKYGIIKKLPVFFDLLTVRFLARYLARPLHFFGTAGLLGATAGSVIGFWLLWQRLIHGVQIMGEHGPLLIFAAVLIVAGVQLLALGLLAEMHVRYYYESRSRSGPGDSVMIVRAERSKASGAAGSM